MSMTSKTTNPKSRGDPISAITLAIPRYKKPKKPFHLKASHIIRTGLFLFITYIGLHIGHAISLYQLYDTTAAIAMAWLQFNITNSPLAWISTITNPTTPLAALTANVIFAFYLTVKSQKRTNFRRKAEHGSAKFAHASDYKHFANPIENKNIYLSDNIKLSIDHHSTGVNLNVVIIGGPGSGKTRGFLKPLVLQMACNYVITDPKGELLKSVGKMLEDNGYTIKVLNLANIEESDFYNPFKYLRLDKSEDVLTLIDVIVSSTNKDGDTSTQSKSGGNDAFWSNAEKMLLQAIFFYILETEPPERQTILTVLEMLDENQISTNGKNNENPLSRRFNRLEKKMRENGKQSMAVSFWKKVSGGNVETMRTVVAIANSRFSLFQAVQNLFRQDTMQLDKIDDRKTAIFITMSPANKALNFIATMVYTQLFQQVDYIATQVNTKSGAEPGLNRLMLFALDEFANLPKIPNFLEMLAYARSLNVGIMPIFQSMVQAETMYDKAWETIIDSCDSFIYLGGNQSVKSTKYISDFLGQETVDLKTNSLSYDKGKKVTTGEQVLGRALMTSSEVGALKKSQSIVKISMVNPVIAPKYKLVRHKNYKLLRDAKKGADRLKASYDHFVPEKYIKYVYRWRITFTEEDIHQMEAQTEAIGVEMERQDQKAIAAQKQPETTTAVVETATNHSHQQLHPPQPDQQPQEATPDYNSGNF